MRYVIKQRAWSLGAGFSIDDAQGVPQLLVTVAGDTPGARLTIKQPDGQEVASMVSKRVGRRTSFEILKNNSVFGHIDRKRSLFGQHFEIDVPGPFDYHASGDFPGRSYRFSRDDRGVAKVATEGVTAADSYAVDIDADQDDIAILAAAIAIDFAEPSGATAPSHRRPLRIALVAAVGLIGALLLFRTLARPASRGDVHIAVATDSPATGGETSSVVRGARLRADEINASGGIHGIRLVLDAYDDLGTAEGARAGAERIVTMANTVAVLGHRLSDPSLAAAPIYQKHGIVAVTPTSTLPEVTAGSGWYYRTVYNNNFLGRFLAHYVHKVLTPGGTIVVRGPSTFETDLGKSFLAVAQEIGLPIEESFFIDPKAADAEAVRASVTARLAAIPGPRAVFLALYPDTAFELIRAIRDAGIPATLVGSDAFARPDFTGRFAGLPNETRSPGFYTDGIQLGTPLVFDTADWQTAHFREKYLARYATAPDWRAAFAYDSLSVIAEAMRRAGDSFVEADPTARRRAIRDGLAAMNSVATAVEGVTGLTYFDANGDATKSVAIAEYQRGELISALQQLRSVRSLPAGQRLEDLIAGQQVLDIAGLLMQRTNVVYTGVELTQVSDVSPKDMTAKLAGELWFRYKPSAPGVPSGPGEGVEAPPESIAFTNAVGPAALEPIGPRVEENDTFYQRFRFAGTFRMDFLPGMRRYGQPTVGVEYRHQTSSAASLLYVPDLLGMGLVGQRSYRAALGPLASALGAAGWRIEGGDFYQGTAWVSGRGQPRYLNLPDAMVPYSKVIAAMQIAPSEFKLYELIPARLDGIALALATTIFVLTAVLQSWKISFRSSGLVTVVQFLALTGVLVFGRQVLFAHIPDTVTFEQLGFLDTVHGSLLWLVPAWYVTRMFEHFVWLPIELRTQRHVPGILRRMTKLVVLLLAGFGVVAFVLDRPLTSLLATSGLITFIIGMAVQVNIANIFSGLVMSLERPFGVGDDVQIGTLAPAKVIDMTWRTTRLKDAMGRLYTIPNAKAAESQVTNYSTGGAIADFVVVQVAPVHDPERVITLLKEAMGECKTLIPKLPWGVIFAGVKQVETITVAEYWAWFLISDYTRRNDNRHEVWQSIWRQLHGAGVDLRLAVHRTDDPTADAPSLLPPVR